MPRLSITAVEVDAAILIIAVYRFGIVMGIYIATRGEGPQQDVSSLLKTVADGQLAAEMVAESVDILRDISRSCQPGALPSNDRAAAPTRARLGATPTTAPPPLPFNLFQGARRAPY